MRADVSCGSKCEELALSICLPLCTPIADIKETWRHFGFVPMNEIARAIGVLGVWLSPQDSLEDE